MAEPSFHPLNTSWTLWAHLPHDIEWTIQSYQRIYTVAYVEHCLALLHSLPEKLVTNCMLFFIREGIQPIWEDKANKNGGCFSFKIPNKLVPDIWTEICCSIAGETLSTDSAFNTSLVGATLSPKKSFCILKIWMTNCTHQNPDKITGIRNLKQQGCLFKKHQPEY